MKGNIKGKKMSEFTAYSKIKHHYETHTYPKENLNVTITINCSEDNCLFSLVWSTGDSYLTSSRVLSPVKKQTVSGKLIKITREGTGGGGVILGL